MVAEPQTKPRWEEAGEPFELTREEIVAYLREHGRTDAERQVTEGQLVSWMARGILPSPTRKLPRLATDGKPRALYPGYFVGVISDLLAEADKGRTLAILKQVAEPIIDQRRQSAEPDWRPTLRVVASHQVRYGIEAATVTPRVPRPLARQARDYAGRVAEMNQRHIKRVLLVLEVEDGQRITVPLNGE